MAASCTRTCDNARSRPRRPNTSAARCEASWIESGSRHHRAAVRSFVSAVPTAARDSTGGPAHAASFMGHPPSFPDTSLQRSSRPCGGECNEDRWGGVHHHTRQNEQGSCDCLGHGLTFPPGVDPRDHVEHDGGCDPRCTRCNSRSRRHRTKSKFEQRCRAAKCRADHQIEDNGQSKGFRLCHAGDSLSHAASFRGMACSPSSPRSSIAGFAAGLHSVPAPAPKAIVSDTGSDHGPTSLREPTQRPQ